MESSLEADSIDFRRIRSWDKSEVNLFTGLYYRLSVKSIPNGLVTFEPESREEGHLIQLALNDLEPYDEGPEGHLRPDSLWTLIPEGAGNEGIYQLRAQSHPDASVTYTHGVSWGGRYMELDLSHPEHYAPGATMHSSALWYIRPSELTDYFTIHNTDPRRQPNYVTFSNEPSDRGQLMQIGTKEVEMYEVKGAFRHDALWSFKPTGYELRAKVMDFKFDVPTDSEISEAVLPIPFLDQVVHESGTRVDYVEEIPEIFNLSFLQSFKLFRDDLISIDSTSFVDKIPFLKGKSGFNFLKRSNTQWGCSISTKYSVSEEFRIPDGFTKVRVRAYCSVVKLLEIPFTAVVQVTAKANGAVSRGSSSCLKELVDVRDEKVIEYLLKFERFSAKIIPKLQWKGHFATGKCGTAPGGKEVNHGESHEAVGVVLCQISGTLKCTCGVDMYLDVKPD